jgi:hypothetical protein
MANRENSVEDRQVERFALTEPDDVAAVVGQIVAGRGVGEDRQTGAVDAELGGHLAELVGLDRHLARAARVRTDGPGVEMAERDGEPLLQLAPQLLGPCKLVGVEVDMGVKIADRGHEPAPQSP